MSRSVAEFKAFGALQKQPTLVAITFDGARTHTNTQQQVNELRILNYELRWQFTALWLFHMICMSLEVASAASPRERS